MSRLMVGVLAGAAGFALGVYAVKLYAQHTVTSDIHSGLAAFGLGGGKIEAAADAFIVPQVVG